MAIFVPRFVRQLRDVLLTAPADGEVLTYDSADQKWKNEAGGGGGGLTFAQILAALAAIGVDIDDTTGVVMLSPTGDVNSLHLIPPPSTGSDSYVPLRVERPGGSAAYNEDLFDVELDGTFWIAPPGEGDDYYLSLAGNVRRSRFYSGKITDGPGQAIISWGAAADGSDAQTLGFYVATTPVVQQTAASVGDLWTALKNYGLLDAGSSAPAVGGAPSTATYITQTPDAGLSAEQALSALATGLVKNTTGTGVLSIAVPGTDYPSQAAFDDHSARHENGGADEFSVAGLSGLLADAQTPLSHAHAGEDITSGTVADARIASTIARDAEVAAGYQPLDADLTQIAALADPNADRILFWDDSLGAYTFLTPGTNLTITGTTIDATGGGGGGVAPDVQTFGAGASQTWTKPSGAFTKVAFYLRGAGGGGGSGRKGAVTTVRCGGGGGGGGGMLIAEIPFSVVSATLTLNVGAGGAGGAAVSASDTNGNNGVAGGTSSVVDGALTIMSTTGGGAGGGGTNAAGAAGTGASGNQIVGTNGGAASGTGGAGAIGQAGSASYPGGPRGGGAGGGISAADAQSAGGNGGQNATFLAVAGGGAGAPGSAASTRDLQALDIGTSGGGGGGSSLLGTPGAGGAGANGSGGGGSGAAVNVVNNSGVGGAGGDGKIVIVCT